MAFIIGCSLISLKKIYEQLIEGIKKPILYLRIGLLELL